METETELQRVEGNNGLVSLPSNPWEFDVDLGPAPEQSMRRLLEAMTVIARHPADDCWSDEQWEAAFPTWLLAAIPRMSKEEADNLLATTPRDKWDSLPWDRLSWLDALRDRGWRWWGWSRMGSKASLVVHIAMYPERMDAFRELLRAAGISILNEDYRGKAGRTALRSTVP